MSLPEYLRAHQIADLLGVTERTVRRWIADGTLPSVKLGGARLVAQAELDRKLVPPFEPPEEDDGGVV